MKFLANLFTGSSNSVLDAAMALVMVLLLILLVAWLVKFLANSRLHIGRPRNHRLAINDSINIDGKRKLILVRCDDREHLILIGGGQDVLIEADLALPEILQSAQLPIQTPTIPEAAPKTAPKAAKDKSKGSKQKKPQKGPTKTIRATLDRAFRALRGLPARNGTPVLNPGTVDAPLGKANRDAAPQFTSETHKQAVERIAQNEHSPKSSFAPKSVLARGLLGLKKSAAEPEKSDIARLQEDLVKSRETMQFHRLAHQHPGIRTPQESVPTTMPTATPTLVPNEPKLAKQSDKGTDKEGEKAVAKKSDKTHGSDKNERDKKLENAKKSQHSNDSDTVGQSLTGKSEKREKSGAKKAESRGKSK